MKDFGFTFQPMRLPDDRLDSIEARRDAQPVNGRPELAPYRRHGQPGWDPAQVDLHESEASARSRERAQWAREHAELVASIRAKLAAR